MDEILKQLTDNELLSESTRTQIQEHWQKATGAFKKEIRESVEQDVRAELAESWVTEREQLITKLDGFLGESLEKELSELKSDVERFRDHEVAQAQKIVEMRKEMATTLAEEMDQLVSKLDAFLEQRLQAEIDELREDIELARQNEVGNKMFEAFRATYESSFVDSDSVQAKLNIAESKLAKAKQEAIRLRTEKEAMIRESKMQDVLRPLSGSAREQMALILKSVPTEELTESYKRFIGRVLREGTDTTQKPITESARPAEVKTGDTQAQPEQPKPAAQLDESILAMQRMAGIIK